MGSELLIALGAAWVGANAMFGGLAMRATRLREASSHPSKGPLMRIPVPETLRDALTGDTETRPTG